ncbi:hypothetical protein Tco_0357144 [Tanacetum coccineum]
MASMNTRLNIKNLNENSVQKHEGSNKLGLSNLVLVLKQVSMEYMFKSVFSLRWNCKELKGIVKLRESDEKVIQTGWKIKTGNVLDSCNQRSTQQCTGSVQVLQGVEFKVEPQEDHTFKVEPHGNVDHVAGSQEVQTQDLIYYHLACDMEQHSTPELFSYREDSNEAIFVVATVDKIYAHESLTFNNTVAYKVISKWKAGLKDDMDARSDVYVLSNGCRKCSDDSDGYYWECKAEIWATKGLLDKAKGNTLLEGHFILSLEGSLSRECDEEKNGKWSCIYTVGSQEYQVVCMRLDITSADVGMLHKFDRGLQTDIQELRSYDAAHDGFLPTEAGYMTLTDAIKEVIWINGLLTESRAKLCQQQFFCY